MPIQVQIGDTGQIAEFPDGTAPEVIEQTLRAQLSQAQPQAEAPQPQAMAPQQPQAQQPGIADRFIEGVGAVGGAINPLATVGSAESLGTTLTGAVAEPIAGLAGIAQAINPFAEEGAGARAVEATREALTYQPRTVAGREKVAAAGEMIAPVGEAFTQAEKFLGDTAFEATGSPALAAAATTVPTALLEAIGAAGAKGAVKRTAGTQEAAKRAASQRAVVESAPSIEQIKDVSRAIYREIDDAGVTLQPKAYAGMVNKVKRDAARAGFDKDLTPKAAAVLNRFESELGRPHTMTEIDTLRKVAQNAAKAIEPADAAIGQSMVRNIDDFLDSVGPTAFKRGAVPSSEVIPKFKMARELWGRARRSEMINEAFEKARNQASGFENGLVVQFRSILNNKKKAKFFKPKELEVMKEVVRGTDPSNLAKLLGRFGFSEGKATNIVGGSIGAIGGGMIAGPTGAVAIPAVGQVSRKLAQRLTRQKADFLDVIVRAGDNADGIARAYLDKTPKGARSTKELAELLMRREIDLDPLIASRNSFTREAAEIARGNRIIAAGQAIPGAAAAVQEENN